MKRAVRQCEETTSLEPPISKKARTSKDCERETKFDQKKVASTKIRIGSKAADGAIVVSDINMSMVGELSEEEFHALMTEKAAKFETQVEASCVQDKDFEFCKNLINAVCDKQVLALITSKLLKKE